jgi:hypothetical protein
MNYLGHSIVDEVGGGGNGPGNVENALNQDTVAMQTVLSNFAPAVSLHPYRFSNGAKQLYTFDNINQPQTAVISGYGTSSSFQNQMTSLNYKGTYEFHVVLKWYGFIIPSIEIPINSFRFGVYIGETLVLPMSFLSFQNFIDTSNPMTIDISGTIDVLGNPSSGPTPIQTTLRYILQNNSPNPLLSTGYNTNTVTVNMTDVVNRNYSMRFVVLKTGGGDPVNNIVYMTRHVGTLNCVYSDPYTG